MENRQIIYIHILIAMVAAISLYLGLKPLLLVSEWVLIVDAIVSGIVLSGLIILLKSTVQFGYFFSLHFKQRIINYSALAVLFVLCWLGITFFVLYISIPEVEYKIITDSIPMRVVLVLLAYSVALSVYAKLYGNRNDASEADIEVDTMHAVVAEKSQPISEADKEIEMLERIVVKNGPKIEVIPVPEVIYIQAEGDYAMIHSIKGRFLKEQTMKSFEATLPSDKFVRVHRSSIINVDYIAQIELYDKQTQLLKLKNGSQVKASLAGYKTLKKTLGL